MQLQLIHSIDKIVILVQKFKTGFISKTEFSLAIAAVLDMHREEIQQYIDNPALLWPPELIAVVRRIGSTGIKNDLLENLVKSAIVSALSAIKRLKETQGTDNTGLLELEEQIKEQLKIRGILLEGSFE